MKKQIYIKRIEEILADSESIHGMVDYEQASEALYNLHIEGVREEREKIADMIHERVVEYHKDKKPLTDDFINGRFWEAKELWEIIRPETVKSLLHEGKA